MCFVNKGIYSYSDIWKRGSIRSLPSDMVINENISTEAILIRLLCGTVKIKHKDDLVVQKTNYALADAIVTKKISGEIFKDFFGFDKYGRDEKDIINKYLKMNRKNHNVHEQLLSELTSAIIWSKKSPVESFVNIYRAVEFMSYSFPLIYASKSKDYKGSYEKLRSFFQGDSEGELKFFNLFLKELFKESNLKDYEFSVFFLDGDENRIAEDFKKILKSDIYQFEGNTMKVKFIHIIDVLVSLRNRYFHMLLGKNTYNLSDIHYDKRKIFNAMNLMFINFVALVYREIVSYSIKLV